MNNINTIGIDIAKRIFQVHGVDKNGKTVLNNFLKCIDLSNKNQVVITR